MIGTMADIFISYKSERRAAAAHLSTILQHHGYSVWFDYGLIKGDDFDLQLDHELRAAKAVVVLWCTMSVESPWVSREASLAARLRTLLPAMIEECELKLAHITADYVDLKTWDGSARSHQLDPLFRGLTRLVARSPQANWPDLTEYEDTWRRFGAPSLATFALGKPIVQPGPAGRTDVTVGTSHSSALAVAAAEWPTVRDSRDLRRLQRFEQHFVGTYYADEARELREALAAEGTASCSNAGEQQIECGDDFRVMVFEACDLCAERCSGHRSEVLR